MLTRGRWRARRAGPRAGLASDSGRTRPRRAPRAPRSRWRPHSPRRRCWRITSMPSRSPAFLRTCSHCRPSRRRCGSGWSRPASGCWRRCCRPLDWLAGALGRSLGCQSPTSSRLAELFAQMPGGQLSLPLPSRAGVPIAYALLAAAAVLAHRAARALGPHAQAAARWRARPAARRVASGRARGRPRAARCSRAGWAGPAGHADRALPRHRAEGRHPRIVGADGGAGAVRPPRPADPPAAGSFAAQVPGAPAAVVAGPMPARPSGGLPGCSVSAVGNARRRTVREIRCWRHPCPGLCR